MLRKMSLRMRLTLLSAIVMASVAIMLTSMFMVSADHFFVQSLQHELVTQGNNDIMLSTAVAEKVDMGQITLTIKQAGNKFNFWGIAGLILILFMGTGATWLMAGRVLKPLGELSNTIEEISGNDLTSRVEMQDRQDEIGKLTQSFNCMMDKVSASFDRQKRFSASAAHELKTPLSTMLVNLDVLNLDEKPSAAQIERVLSIVRTNTERMIRLVDDLFRLTSEKSSEMGEIVPLKEIFEEIIIEISPLIQEKHLTISILERSDQNLIGNRVMLYRAMSNVIENAAKYNCDNGSITISSERTEETIIVRIEDTGIGIPHEELSHIFEPFYRVDQSRSRMAGGAGLGLPLVKDIVEKHNGSIMVKSVFGKGTIFTLYFPITT